MLNHFTRNSALKTRHFLGLGFAQGAQSLSIHSGLLHGPECTLLIGVVKPSTFPEITRGRRGWNLGTTISMERHSVDPTGNVKPICHSRAISDG